MPSVQSLREFINERLTAAAEQIFLEFEKTIVQYEEEIDRQRRLLDITWKPQIKLHRTVPPDIPQQPVCEEEEEVLPEQQLWNQERSSSVDQEEPEPPQIKEEQEELCSSQEGEQLGLKEEPDTFMVTAAEEGDHSEPGGDGEQLLAHSSAGAENQDQEGSKNSRSSRKRNKSHKNEEGPTASGSRCNSACMEFNPFMDLFSLLTAALLLTIIYSFTATNRDVKEELKATLVLCRNLNA
ncbi:uncharacterized protein LOC134616386 isoform X3 [Pelmatolapia mariae]|uniref:uncharacterized protein LOC134616386 isoform X3 n=1 Tax=Pelmatolapia mariae TaxID=158779 RepID=UPI002FE5CCEA